MEPRKDRTVVIAVAAAAVALTFGLCVGCVAGGLAAGIIGWQSIARVEGPAAVPAPLEMPEPLWEATTPARPTSLPPAATREAPATPERRALPTPLAIPQGLAMGAFIREVIEGSPADDAGLRVGDIVIQVDDVSLTGMQAERLADVIAGYEPGDIVMLGVIRGEMPREIEVTLGEHPDIAGQPYLGVRYVDLANGRAPAPTD